MQGHLFHVKLHLTSSICPWQHQVHRVIGKQEVGGRQRAICVMCSIKSAICATLLLCQMACSRVAKVWGLQRKSPGFRRAFNESFHAFGDIARKSFNVIHHERFKWKPSFSERFAITTFFVGKCLQIWLFCRVNLHTRALRKLWGFVGAFQKVATLYSTFLHFHLLVWSSRLFHLSPIPILQAISFLARVTPPVKAIQGFKINNGPFYCQPPWEWRRELLFLNVSGCSRF